MTRIGLAICVALAVLAAAGCGGDEASGWERLPASPLSPREFVTAHWTGEEVLLVGGSDAPPCPPSASCVTPTIPPLADGAAFDPATRTWRTIASAPVPFEWAEVVQVGDIVYFSVPGTSERPGAQTAFLAYDLARDRWTNLPVPADSDFYAGLAEANGRLVSYSWSDEFGEQPDWSFDPATGAWTELPDDPFGPTYSRYLAWEDGELVLHAKDLGANPSGDEPWRVAVFDPDTNEWREPADGEFPDPLPVGTVDGGPLDAGPRAAVEAAWDTLENPPAGQEDFGQGAFATALVTGTDVAYFRQAGWGYDATTGRWFEVPALPTDAADSRTYVTAGRDLLAFGMIDWDGLEGTFVNETWLWSPDAAAD